MAETEVNNPTRKLNAPLCLHHLMALLTLLFALGILASVPGIAANLFAADGTIQGQSAPLLAKARLASVLLAVLCSGLTVLTWQTESRTTGLRIGHAVAIACGLLACLVITETTLRVRSYLKYGVWLCSPIPTQPPLLVFGTLRFPQPGYYAVPIRNDLTGQSDRIAVQIDQFGFKSHSAVQPRKSAFRILCVGGSTTFGWNLTNHQTYPAQLQKLCDDQFGIGRVEVINAGVPAFTAEHVNAALQRRLLKLEPDMILYYGGYNDVWRGFADQNGDLAEAADATDESSGTEPIPLDLGPPRCGPVRISLCTLAAVSLVRRDSRAGYSLNPSETDRANDPLSDKYIEHLRAQLSHMVEICRENNIQLVLASFATCWNPEVPRLNDPQRWARAAQDMLWVAAGAMHQAFQLARHAMRETAVATGVPIMDGGAQVPPDRANFYDSVHLSPVGAQKLANGFFRIIQDKIK